MALALFGMVLASIHAEAAPRRMADGGIFDAAYYAAMYPDVVKALGTDETALYQHYLTFGRAEGRQAFSTEAAPIDLESKIPALKARYPEGMRWSSQNTYQNDAVAPFSVFTGCSAFAMMISDEIYGKEAPMVELHPSSTAELRPGDIARIFHDSHSVLVLSVDSRFVTVCEGNYGGTVHWEGRYPRAQLEGDITYIHRRIVLEGS
ncbi:MAG: hypothetical protein ACI4OJ_07465 [Lachnospiraceae bacterium]